ncbi:DUF1272 domain-containing protein [Fredinandcohnia humi]
MGLEMRKKCEKCNKELHNTSIAYICTYECTFCEDCTENMNHNCPNCGGELVRRPRSLKVSVSH